MQQWSAGLRRPLQPYQGEKTEPMKPMTETAWLPSREMPSTYHQA